MKKVIKGFRASSGIKNAGGKQWYKDHMDTLDTNHMSYNYRRGDVSEYKRMKVNYDLFNSILDEEDFAYVCKPFGAEVGDLPANMVNRDIVSGKIKALMGMEMKRPFSWTTIAVNPEATTRKEQEEFGRIREFVTSEIMKPIRQQLEASKMQELNGKEPNDEEMQQIQAQIEEEMQAMTPEEVRRYMEREHQDPAEMYSNQLLNYLMEAKDVRRKFNEGFKHLSLSAKEVYYVGIKNDEPNLWVINPLRFSYDKSPDIDFIEDSEWATYEYRMTPSTLVSTFGKELKDKEIDSLYEDFEKYADGARESMFSYENFNKVEDPLENDDHGTIRVLHCVWKALRKIGFLTYMDDEGNEQEMMVPESYKFNEDFGDINLKWEWIPEVYEGWKIGNNMYKRMRPVPGQFKDLENLHVCKLPYYGAVVDNMNSQETSLMDRLKFYQYMFNIIYYKIELLMASDDGKKVLMNIGAIPKSKEFNMKTWQYYAKTTPFMWFDNTEEGNEYVDANNIAKEIDLSLVSDISKYIELAENIRKQCGEAVGITPQVEGQIGEYDAVRNTNQAITQSSHILEPYFDLHNHVKRNVLQALLETAKVAYHGKDKLKLSYTLDDMSKKMTTIDMGLVDDSTIGIFLQNSSKATDIKKLIEQLAHAAMQNQTIEMSDVIAVIRQDDIISGEETLKVAESRRRQNEQQMQKGQQEHEAQMADKMAAEAEKAHEREIDKIVTKEEERRETELQKAALLGASFNPDQDKDQDGLNDFIEIAKQGLDADIKQSDKQLKREKFEHEKARDNKKLELEEKKIKKMAAKK